MLEKMLEIAESITYGYIYVSAGMERKVVTKLWEKGDKKRTYIKIYCYTLAGNFKRPYDLGYVDMITNEYVVGNDIDLNNIDDRDRR